MTSIMIVPSSSNPASKSLTLTLSLLPHLHFFVSNDILTVILPSFVNFTAFVIRLRNTSSNNDDNDNNNNNNDNDGNDDNDNDDDAMNTLIDSKFINSNIQCVIIDITTTITLTNLSKYVTTEVIINDDVNIIVKIFTFNKLFQFINPNNKDKSVNDDVIINIDDNDDDDNDSSNTYERHMI